MQKVSIYNRKNTLVLVLFALSLCHPLPAPDDEDLGPQERDFRTLGGNFEYTPAIGGRDYTEAIQEHKTRLVEKVQQQVDLLRVFNDENDKFADYAVSAALMEVADEHIDPYLELDPPINSLITLVQSFIARSLPKHAGSKGLYKLAAHLRKVITDTDTLAKVFFLRLVYWDKHLNKKPPPTDSAVQNEDIESELNDWLRRYDALVDEKQTTDRPSLRLFFDILTTEKQDASSTERHFLFISPYFTPRERLELCRALHLASKKEKLSEGIKKVLTEIFLQDSALAEETKKIESGNWWQRHWHKNPKALCDYELAQFARSWEKK